MAYMLAPDVRGGGSVAHRWLPFMRGGLALDLESPRHLTEAQLAELAAYTWLIEHGGRIPEVMGVSTGPFAVLSTIRDWLKQHDPHLVFYPVIVKSSKPIAGTTDHGCRDVIGAIPILEPMDVEQTAWAGGMYGRPDGRTISSNPDKPCVVFKETIAGHHFWKTSHRHGSRFMCSDEFWAYFKKNRYRGLDILKHCVEV